MHHFSIKLAFPLILSPACNVIPAVQRKMIVRCLLFKVIPDVLDFISTAIPSFSSSLLA